MRSNLVVLTPELFDRDLRIDPVSEPLHRETFIAELPVERFVGAILPGLPRVYVRGVYVEGGEPLQHGPGYKLRPIVRSQILRTAVNAHQSAEHFDYPSG